MVKRNLLIRTIIRLGIVLAVLSLASAIGFVLRDLKLPITNIAIVYMLAVLLTALMVPIYFYGFLSSVLSAFAFNFLFTEPYFTFTANAPSYVITFIIMTITAFSSSTLASHAKLSARHARARELETRALNELMGRLVNATDRPSITKISLESISELLAVRATIVDDDDEMLASGDVQDWPIQGQDRVLAHLRLASEDAAQLNADSIRLLKSIIESAALALDRVLAAEERMRTIEANEQERYRGNLLRSISHDLRTPLSGILGSSEMLLQMTPPEDRRFDIIEGIEQDANWLYTLVENVLSLTRMQDGKLLIHKQLEAVEEIFAAVMSQMKRRHPLYRFEAQAPDTLLLVPMDAKLISQVLINLVENAIHHSQVNETISLLASRDDKNDEAIFVVRDNGSGIPENDLPNVFQMFYTGHPRHTDSRPGVGLGLAICESIVKAHGGHIAARNRAEQNGAEIVFSLPMKEESNHE